MTPQSKQRKNNAQGAKEVIFTACHLCKLKLTFTSPNIISTSPKNVLMSTLISQFFCNLNSSKKLHLPVEQVNNRIHYPDSKIHWPPGYQTLLSLHTGALLHLLGS